MPVDKQEVKRLGAGQWAQLITQATGASEDFFFHRHGPCPKCGGTDRWRVFGDFEQTGGGVCNQCGKFADGIAVVQWLKGCTTFDAIESIGKVLGIKEPEKAKSKRTSKKTQPEDRWKTDLVWVDPNPKMIAQWCNKKQPITPEGLAAAGAKYARYKGQFKVIAIPMRDHENEIVGYSLYNLSGGAIPFKADKDSPVQHLKVKVVGGNKTSGWMGRLLPGEGPVFKMEGPSDMLALLSVAPADVSVISNPFGAGEKPHPWQVKSLRGRIVYTIHDCDVPGQSGAIEVLNGDRSRPGWATAIAEEASESRNVVLPYDIVESHGKDLRDWLTDQIQLIEPAEAYALFYAMATKSSVVEAKPSEEIELIEAVENPSRLARVNLERYEAVYGGTLKFWKDEWWRYKAGKYTRLGNSEVSAKLHSAIRTEFEDDFRRKIEAGERPDAVRPINTGLINNVIAATKERCLLPGSVTQPSWLGDGKKNPHWISVANGILDLQSIFDGQEPDKHLLQHDWRWFSACQLDYPYDPSAKCPQWEQTIEEAMEGDYERIMILQEWTGYLLTATNYLQRFLAIQGEGSNGKSVYFAGVTAMLGSENVGHVSLENFGGRFDLGTLIGKTANICGDVGEIDSVCEGNLKQFSGGDVMQFDRKNLSPICCRPTAKLMMSFNNPPRIKDRSRGVWRRMLLVPFLKEFKKETAIRHLDSPEFWLESGEVPGILNWSIAGLQRLRDQGDFTESQTANDAIETYKRDNNPALDFFEDYLVYEKGNGQVDTMHVYELYRHWCAKTGAMPFGSRQFGVEIRRKFGDIKVREMQSGVRRSVYKGLRIGTEYIFDRKTDEGFLFT
jgi:P4 family phage/plasmid primase-like protien